MRNFLAGLLVVLFLGACSAYVVESTHPRQTLVPSMPATHWADYVRQGGAFKPKQTRDGS